MVFVVALEVEVGVEIATASVDDYGDCGCCVDGWCCFDHGLG